MGKSFLKRHSTERISQNIKVSRGCVGHETIMSYFSNLKAEIDDVSLSNIVNYCDVMHGNTGASQFSSRNLR